jgi:hypothetical protein
LRESPLRQFPGWSSCRATLGPDLARVKDFRTISEKNESGETQRGGGRSGYNDDSDFAANGRRKIIGLRITGFASRFHAAHRASHLQQTVRQNYSLQLAIDRSGENIFADEEKI